MVDDLVIVEKNIKINIARSFIDDLFASHDVFNILKLIQESHWS